MPKELGDMKARFVGRTPAPKLLVRKDLRIRNSPEEIHPPLCPLRTSRIDVKQTQWNLDLTNPRSRTSIQFRLRLKTIGLWIHDKEVIEWSSLFTVFGGVVDEGLVCHVVGIDFILEICLRILSPLVDERLDDFVLPNIIVCTLRRVEIEALFVKGRESQGECSGGIAEVDLRTGKGILIGYGL